MEPHWSPLNGSLLICLAQVVCETRRLAWVSNTANGLLGRDHRSCQYVLLMCLPDRQGTGHVFRFSELNVEGAHGTGHAACPRVLLRDLFAVYRTAHFLFDLA
jgi:hypothetical protein